VVLNCISLSICVLSYFYSQGVKSNIIEQIKKPKLCIAL